MKSIKKIGAIIFILSQIISLFAEEVLNNLNTNWSIVVPGKVVTEPAITNYGFSIITDSKLLSTYSNSGILLWEKAVNRYRDASIYTIDNDFILLVTDKNSKLTLLNPSGVELWSKEIDSPLLSKPLCGWDGRIFLSTKDFIECIGISGLLKWHLDISDLSTIPFQTLPDGSFVVFFETLENGKTKGLRISPFGEVLEEITFAGQVVSAQTHNQGIALTFTDCTAGLFTLEENQSKNKWVLQNNGAKGSGTLLPSKSKFLLCDDNLDSEFIYLQAFSNSLNLYKINPEDGQVIRSFSINNIDSINLEKTIYNKAGIFICDNSQGYFFNDSGLELWSAQLPQNKGKNEWNYIIYTHDNHLIICNTNWTLNSYRVSQATKNISDLPKPKNYKNWYTINTADFDYIFQNSIDADVVSEKRVSIINKGNYGKDEINYISELLSACEVYKNNLSAGTKTNRQGPSIFDLDSIGTERLVTQLTMYSTDTFCSYEAYYLQAITNKTILNTLLQGISNFGYDPTGTVLNALEVLAKKTSYKEELIISRICDATYSVCKFMGRPAFNSKGKVILQNFLFPSYSANTRTYARETMKKISALDL